MANGLQYLHSENITHGDIKPADIFIKRVKESVVFKLADFGRSKMMKSRTNYSISSTGIKGTFYWMPPEGLAILDSDNEREPTPFATDIFSLGCVFFYLVSNEQHPFGQRESIQHNIVQGNPVNLNISMYFSLDRCIIHVLYTKT